MARQKFAARRLDLPIKPLVPAKERIMKAAWKFYPVGGIQVPLATIANEAQTNIATIHKYYGSQEGLVIAFLRHCEEEMDLNWQSLEEEHPDDAGSQVRSWVDGAQILAVNGDWSCFDLLRAAAFFLAYPDSRALAYIRRLKRRERDKLADKCRAARFSDPSGLADKLMLLVEGAMAGNLVHGEKGPAIELLKAAELMMAPHKLAV